MTFRESGLFCDRRMQFIVTTEITSLWTWRLLRISRPNRRHAVESALKPVQTSSIICTKMQPRRNSQHGQCLDE
jgi:hypothetical protein